MRRFKNILVVADERSASDAVLDRAAWLASANEATLTLVDALGGGTGELSRLLSTLSLSQTEEVEDQVLEVHRERLEGLAAPMRKDGLRVETKLLHGTSFLQTIRHVLTFDNDLVIKGAHRGPDRPFLRGPDLHLLRKCPCPVWILNGESAPKARRILAAIDPDPQDRIRNNLNRLVLELSTSLARQDGAKLDVINAWHLQEESILRHSRLKLREEDVRAIVASAEKESAGRLDSLMANFTEFEDLMRVLHIKGIASDVISEHVSTEGIDTLVMGTIARTGIEGFFIGNTAETILNRVGCSVLTVKPEGFVSPVTLDPGDPLA
ncbi:MAG: universal stress protein [Pseudomonadota bacterium]